MINPLDFVPGSWKLAAFAVGALSLVGLISGGILVVEKHGYDKAAATYQPKLDQANHALGEAEAANAENLTTIQSLTAEAAANDLLAQQYADRVTALNQQAADAAAAIRKLSSDDQTVAAYLRTPVPSALRSMLGGPAAPGHNPAADRANPHGAAAAAR